MSQINTNDTPTLGKKLRKYRRKSGFSQQDLELEVNVSNGTISRIETDQINPTKETLLKLTDALDISTLEKIDMVYPDLEQINDFLDLFEELFGIDSIEDVPKINDIITKEFDIISSGILLQEPGTTRLHLHSFSNKFWKEKFLSIIGADFQRYFVDLNKHKENLFIKAYHENKVFYTEDFHEFCQGAFTKKMSKLVKNLIGFRCAYIHPLLGMDDKPIGGIVFMKNTLEVSNVEKEFFTRYARITGKIISRLRNQEELLKKGEKST